MNNKNNAPSVPGDVCPESGFRLPLPDCDELDDYGKTVYDNLSNPEKPLVAGLRGPTGIRLHSPKVAEISHSLNHYLRHETEFSSAIRELAILITAREMDSQFEWAAHEPVAIKEGLSRKAIDVVKYRKPAAGLPEDESVLIEFGRRMFGQRKVDSEILAKALEIYGPKDLVDLVSLMGYYASTAALLTAFDMQLAEDQEKLLP